MFKQYSFHLLETAINAALALDEASEKKLRALEGKVLLMVLLPLDLRCWIRFSSTGVRLHSSMKKEADASIYGHPWGWIRLGYLPAAQKRTLFQGEVRVEGDLEVAQQVQKLMDQLDIDWEGQLARLTGDMVAYYVGSGVRGLKRHLQQGLDALSFQTEAYVTEEINLTPPTEALHDFFDEVDELALAVERLEAKLNQVPS